MSDDDESYVDEGYGIPTKNETKTKHPRRRRQFQVSGRDDTLLKLLAQKMNFKFEYVDVRMMEMDENVTMAGALGLQMLQKRVLLFDIFSCYIKIYFPIFFSLSFFLLLVCRLPYRRKRILCSEISLSLTRRCRKLSFPSLPFRTRGDFSHTPHDGWAKLSPSSTHFKWKYGLHWSSRLLLLAQFYIWWLLFPNGLTITKTGRDGRITLNILTRISI